MGHAPRDLNGCYPWAVKGYELGNANATETLGWYYFCIDDEAKANEYFNKASDLGSILAMARYGTDPEKKRMRNELLFKGEAVLTDGMGISDCSEYYNSEGEKATWRRRAEEYGWK